MQSLIISNKKNIIMKIKVSIEEKLIMVAYAANYGWQKEKPYLQLILPKAINLSLHFQL